MARQSHLTGINPGPSARTRQKAGDTAEARADAMHRACELAGVALVRRVSSHLRLVAGGKVVPTKKGTVDCLGVLRGGRMIAVEVKSCADGRLSLDRLPDHQCQELAAVEAFGGLALVLVVGQPDCWAVPWAVVHAALAAGAASLGPAQLAPHKVDPRAPYLARFLEAAP